MTATRRDTYVPQKTNAAVETYAATIATVREGR